MCLYCVTFAESEPYCHSILFVCLSIIPRPTAYHDWSITTKFGRQVYNCPRTRVSLFGSPISHTFSARGKNMQNFAYFQHVFLPLQTWRIVPYCIEMLTLTLANTGLIDAVLRRHGDIFLMKNDTVAVGWLDDRKRIYTTGAKVH